VGYSGKKCDIRLATQKKNRQKPGKPGRAFPGIFSDIDSTLGFGTVGRRILKK